jgi:glycosyltransferase involved in cell wall biosynthesis
MAGSAVRLLFAIKSLGVLGGGAERVLVDVANGMSDRGHAVQILSFDRPDVPCFYSLDPRIGRLDLGICDAGQPTPRARFARAMLRVRRAALSAKPDLVVPFMHSTYVPLTAALLGTGVRIVLSEHANAAHFETRPLQRALVRIADRLALAKTVPAASVRATHSPAIQEKVHVMPNPVDVAHFAKIRNCAPSHPPILLCVGRFMQEKNQIDLVQAFASIAHDYTNWTLKLVGEGSLRPNLESAIAALQMQDRILMPGASRDVASEYAAASIVVVPSLYESFGLVAAEALASGRPVVAYDNCVGITEVVQHGINGVLVPSQGDRVGNLAAELRRLMGEEPLRDRLGKAGPESVMRYGIKQTVDAWEKLLLSLNMRDERAWLR